MSRRRNQQRPSAKPTQDAAKTVVSGTFDSFQNFMTRTGIGTGSAQDGATYGFNPITRNRTMLEFAYRGSWIVGQAVDTVAEDMTREGIEIHSDMAPDEIEEIIETADELQVWDTLCDTIKWSRLYGGAVAVMLIDGQKLDTPLKLDTIRKGQFKGLIDIDRWFLQPSMNQMVRDFGPHYGMPEFYDVMANGSNLPTARIHYTRIIRLHGVDLPLNQRFSENGWGQSVVERLWDRLVAFDSTTNGAAQLVHKAHLRTYKVESLRELIATGGKALEALTKQIDMIRQFQSNEGLTLMDAKDEFEANQYTFSGLSDMMLQFGQQISGALQIPLVRLFGQSPAGLNSTGESDLRNYYDGIKQQQSRRLGSGVRTLYEVIYRSVRGKEPSKWKIGFKPLWQLSDEQKASITNQITTSVVGAYDSQIIDRATALKELRQASRITGAFSNITDEDIKEAENEMPPSPDEVLNDDPSKQEKKPDAGPDKKPVSGQEGDEGKTR